LLNASGFGGESGSAGLSRVCAPSAFLGNEFLTEDVSRCVEIVRLAEQTDVIDSRQTAECEGKHVLEGEKMALGAAPSLGIHERALASVPFPNGASHFDRNGPRVSSSIQGSFSASRVTRVRFTAPLFRSTR
jgi:hypothetical protein